MSVGMNFALFRQLKYNRVKFNQRDDYLQREEEFHMDFKTKEELFAYLKAQDDKISQLQETVDNANPAVDEEVEVTVDDVTDETSEDQEKTPDEATEDEPSEEELDEISQMLNL